MAVRGRVGGEIGRARWFEQAVALLQSDMVDGQKEGREPSEDIGEWK